METVIQHATPQTRAGAGAYSQPLGNQHLSSWQSLSLPTGASQKSLQVFATAYQNSAQSGRMAHGIFAQLAK